MLCWADGKTEANGPALQLTPLLRSLVNAVRDNHYLLTVQPFCGGVSSGTLATIVSNEWIGPLSRSIPIWAFIPSSGLGNFTARLPQIRAGHSHVIRLLISQHCCHKWGDCSQSRKPIYVMLRNPIEVCDHTPMLAKGSGGFAGVSIDSASPWPLGSPIAGAAS